MTICNKSIANFVKSVREDAGLRQYHIAKLLNKKSHTIISLWENDKQEVLGGHTLKIYKAIAYSNIYWKKDELKNLIERDPFKALWKLLELYHTYNTKPEKINNEENKTEDLKYGYKVVDTKNINVGVNLIEEIEDCSTYNIELTKSIASSRNKNNRVADSYIGLSTNRLFVDLKDVGKAYIKIDNLINSIINIIEGVEDE